MPTEAPRRAELADALRPLTDRADRLVEAAATFQRALAARDIRLVIVGGSAITAWDSRVHTSLDIDLVGIALTAELDEVFCDEFGLQKEGRHWYDEELRLAVERPGTTLEPRGAETVELQSPSGAPVLVIALEDLVVSRVLEWEATGAFEAWVQTAGMLGHPALERERLGRRAREAGVAEPLAVVEWLAAERAARRPVRTGESTKRSSACADSGASKAQSERSRNTALNRSHDLSTSTCMRRPWCSSPGTAANRAMPRDRSARATTGSDPNVAPPV